MKIGHSFKFSTVIELYSIFKKNKISFQDNTVCLIDIEFDKSKR